MAIVFLSGIVAMNCAGNLPETTTQIFDDCVLKARRQRCRWAVPMQRGLFSADLIVRTRRVVTRICNVPAAGVRNAGWSRCSTEFGCRLSNEPASIELLVTE